MMVIRLLRVPAVLVLALVAGTLGATSAVAFTPDPDFSRVKCYYTTVSQSPWEVALERLEVLPPKLGQQAPGDRVGWKFIVSRDGNVIYRSPIQARTASSKGWLGFTPMGVSVTPPGWPSADHFRAFGYRVVIKVIRYAPNGSVKSSQKIGVYSFRVFIDGTRSWDETEFCYGRMRELSD